MTATVFNTKVKGAATHAIVIGVGHYPHLPGGSSPVKFTAEPSLGQLASPPVSARAIARWLIEEYRHPAKPLASVRLLLSDSKSKTFEFIHAGKQKQVETLATTMPEVKQAVRAWHDDGNQNADHLLLFFFCGHGIAASPDLGLLLADFGAEPKAPLEGSIHFRVFRNNMDTCAAREQCYFIDACRVATDTLIIESGNAGQSIIDKVKTYNVSGRLRQEHTFYSTLAGAKAYARPGGQPSLFTEALLEGLKGAGCEEATPGQWQVEAVILHRALSKLMQDASLRLAVPEIQLSTADDNATVMLNTVAAPVIPLTVGCRPREANGVATLHCTNGAEVRKRGPDKKHKTWKLIVPIGEYDFAARFRAAAGYQLAELLKHPIRPTFPYIELKVK